VEIIIGIGLIVLVIYGIIKLIVFLAPYVGKVILFAVGVGVAAGLVVGIVFGFKNCIVSINENISNKAFKNAMIVITSLFILMSVCGIVYSGPGIIQDIRDRNKFTPNYNFVTEAETYTNKIVNSDGLNVREGPSANAAIKFVLYRNTIVKVYDKGKSGEWVKIYYDGKEGYVNKTFLKEAK